MAKQTKDTYYFKHDATTPSDPKIIKLRRILGREGSDVFFDILCKLRTEAEHHLPEASIADLAYDLRYPEVKLRKLLNDFDLFEFVNGFFHSPRLSRDMEEYNAKKAVYQQKGKKGGEAKAKNIPTSTKAEVQPNSTSAVAIIYNNSKVNKDNESIAPVLSSTRGDHCPTWEAVQECFHRLGRPEKAYEFFEYWEALGWMKGITPISNFASFANRWLSNPISQAQANMPAGRKVIVEHNGGEVTWTEQQYQQYCNNPAASGYTFIRYEL